MGILLALMAAALAGVGVQLPEAEDPALWQDPLALYDLEVWEQAGAAPIVIRARGDTWEVTVERGGDRVSLSGLAPPADSRAREALASRLASLLQPIGLELPEEPVGPAERAAAAEDTAGGEAAGAADIAAGVADIAAGEAAAGGDTAAVTGDAADGDAAAAGDAAAGGAAADALGAGGAADAVGAGGAAAGAGGDGAVIAGDTAAGAGSAAADAVAADDAAGSVADVAAGAAADGAAADAAGGAPAAADVAAGAAADDAATGTAGGAGGEGGAAAGGVAAGLASTAGAPRAGAGRPAGLDGAEEPARIEPSRSLALWLCVGGGVGLRAYTAPGPGAQLLAGLAVGERARVGLGAALAAPVAVHAEPQPTLGLTALRASARWSPPRLRAGSWLAIDLGLGGELAWRRFARADWSQTALVPAAAPELNLRLFPDAPASPGIYGRAWVDLRPGEARIDGVYVDTFSPFSQELGLFLSWG